MSKELAVARVAAIETEVRDLLIEARSLCSAYRLSLDVTNVGTGVYRQNFTIDNSGDFEAWESSDWSASYEDE